MKIKKIIHRKNKNNINNSLQHLNSIYKIKSQSWDTNISSKNLSNLWLKTGLKQTKKSNIKSSLSDGRIMANYLRQRRLLKNKKIGINGILIKFKNKQNASLKKKIIYLKNKIKLYRIHQKLGKNVSFKKSIPIKYNKSKKAKFVLPWIVEGREEQLKLEHTLMLLLFKLKKNQINKNKRIVVLTSQDRKLIKQYRRKAKFSKFGRYGTHAKSRIKLNKLRKFKAKLVKPIKKTIKRQQIYLQNKRLCISNNVDHMLSYKYIYALIVIWYILDNVLLIEEKKTFEFEIWFNYFLKNLWVQQTGSIGSTTTNWYLNYGTITSLDSISQPIILYNSNASMANYQLKPLRSYDRLFIGISNKKKLVNIKPSFKLKRKSRVRHFFRISPKLKNNKKTTKFFFNKKTKKKVKMQRRLSAPEWLLMSKFTRKKYQDKFSSVFSQLKNVKKIQKYINKQSQVWHQPYFITHPYYYTNRYNTFIYQMAQE